MTEVLETVHVESFGFQFFEFSKFSPLENIKLTRRWYFNYSVCGRDLGGKVRAELDRLIGFPRKYLPRCPRRRFLPILRLIGSRRFELCIVNESFLGGLPFELFCRIQSTSRLLPLSGSIQLSAFDFRFLGPNCYGPRYLDLNQFVQNYSQFV